MPRWSDLSEWLKVQLAVLAMAQWEFQTFTIHVHPKLEAEWVAGGRTTRKKVSQKRITALPGVAPSK